MANSATDVEVRVDGGQVVVRSPYHPEFPSRGGNLGGVWDPDEREWTFDGRDEHAVRALCVEVYGTDGTPVATVTVRVDLAVFPNTQSVYFCGRRIAHRPGRDSAVRLGEGVILWSGVLPESGGSVKYPRVDAANETIVKIRDIPAGHADLDHLGVTVVDTRGELAELEAQRARLRAELADVDAAIARLS